MCVIRDIENVPIPVHVSPMDCLGRLRAWLRAAHLDGPGVDLRITVVYCPGKVATHPHGELHRFVSIVMVIFVF